MPPAAPPPLSPRIRRRPRPHASFRCHDSRTAPPVFKRSLGPRRLRCPFRSTPAGSSNLLKPPSVRLGPDPARSSRGCVWSGGMAPPASGALSTTERIGARSGPYGRTQRPGNPASRSSRDRHLTTVKWCRAVRAPRSPRAPMATSTHPASSRKGLQGCAGRSQPECGGDLSGLPRVWHH